MTGRIAPRILKIGYRCVTNVGLDDLADIRHPALPFGSSALPDYDKHSQDYDKRPDQKKWVHITALFRIRINTTRCPDTPKIGPHSPIPATFCCCVTLS